MYWRALMDSRLYYALRRIYGSLTDQLIDGIFKPPRRFYVRVNTALISRDELIDLLRSRGLRPEPDPYVEEAIYFIVEGPFKVRDTGKYVYVDRYTAESVMLGANLYRPGIIKYDDFNAGEEVSVATIDHRVVAVVETVVSSDRLKYMEKGLVGYNMLSTYRAPSIRELPEYYRGYMYSQSLPAMIVSKIIDPKPYELIVDLNAAPGGKTSHVVQLTRGRSRVVAFDRNVKKALRIVENLELLHLYRNVLVLPMDSRYADADLGLQGRVDKVLVDPPCTSLGVRPKLVIDKTFDDVRVLREYQKQFLRVASRIVRRGGLIVYSTCTLTFEENELNTLDALKHGLESVDPGFLPYSEKVVYRDIIAYRYSPLTHDMPGYYIALLRKK